MSKQTVALLFNVVVPFWLPYSHPVSCSSSMYKLHRLIPLIQGLYWAFAWTYCRVHSSLGWIMNSLQKDCTSHGSGLSYILRHWKFGGGSIIGGSNSSSQQISSSGHAVCAWVGGGSVVGDSVRSWGVSAVVVKIGSAVNIGSVSVTENITES